MSLFDNIFVNTLAFQPKNPPSIDIGPGAPENPSNLAGTEPLRLNDPQLGGGFGTGPVNAAGIGTSQNINPFQSSGFPGVSFTQNDPFGSSIVTGGGNTANLTTPIVPSGGDQNASFTYNPSSPASPGADGVPSNQPGSSGGPYYDPFTGTQITPSTGTPGTPDTSQPFFDPFTGFQINPLAQTGNSAAGKWWDWFISTSKELMQRFGLIVLGIVLIAAAAWAVTREK